MPSDFASDPAFVSSGAGGSARPIIELFRVTRLAPAARWRSASARVRYFEVASMTTSTPSSPQGGVSCDPFSSVSILTCRPAT